MKMRIRDEAAGAKGGMYRYRNPEDGFLIEHPNVGIVQRRAREYRQLNNYPIGVNFDDDLIQNICVNTPAPSCVEDGLPSMAARAVSLATALSGWARQGFPTRSKEEAESVLGICQSCEYYSGSRSLFKVACKHCGCSSKKAYLLTEHCPIGKW